MVDQTAQIPEEDLLPTSYVTLRAHIAWASVYILTFKMSVMTCDHHGAVVKIK